ncbi:MAG: septum formation protein Maf [Selenomonadales bacterium]|jgi:septum formation protein|nr:septum formation protein Maf [Selenomonadales bacterium]
MTIFLASASPRRLLLLRQIGVEPVVVSSSFVEGTELSGDPVACAREYAEMKALGALPLPSAGVCIAADTVVHLHGRLLGKPETPEHAAWMLGLLSGESHEVVTGVAVLRSAERCIVRHATTRVDFRALSPAEIRNYVATGEPLDKAGGYAIQGAAAVFVRGIAGCYSNVVGLPLSLLYEMLQELGVDLMGMGASR